MFRRMTRERYLSDLELARFLAAVRTRRHAHQPRDYALFVLLANTGLRPAEARALTVGDCHTGDPIPWVRVVRLKKKKALREIDDLPIPPVVCEALQAHINGSATNVVLFEIGRRQMHRLFRYYCGEAGVRPMSLYSLRHTAATRLYRETRNLKLVQAVLGHEKPDMTALYAHVDDAVLVDLSRSFPAFI